MVPRHELCAEADHCPTHYKRAKNSPEQHSVLELRRHSHVFEDHRDHEHVVGAERHLDEVAGEEFHRREPAVVNDTIDTIDVLPEPEPMVLIREIHEHVEQRCQRKPTDGEGQRFLHRDDVVAVQNAQVECEYEQDEE